MSRVLPILFNTDMVRAILEGRKTLTRRVVKFLPGKNPNWTGYIIDGLVLYNGTNEPCNKPCQYQPGDILYVRETWSDHYVPDEYGEPNLEYCYKADGIDLKGECLPGENNRWYPSIHMPKEAARIWLKVTNVRVERLQEITEEQAISEGAYVSEFDLEGGYTHIDEFIHIWNSTLKKSDLDRYGWDANPWVWVIEFERCKKPEEDTE